VNATLAMGNASLATDFVNATNFEITPMPTHAHIDDLFATVLSSLIGFLYALAFIWPVTKIVKQLVEEKENRIKEGMKMMGLSETALFLSHLTTYIFVFAVIAILCMLVTLNTYENSDKGFVFTFFFFYGLCIFFFCFMLSSFFSKARTACKSRIPSCDHVIDRSHAYMMVLVINSNI
jgi:ATP-binding cassette subfamily A (ABC1) protein 3